MVIAHSLSATIGVPNIPKTPNVSPRKPTSTSIIAMILIVIYIGFVFFSINWRANGQFMETIYENARNVLSILMLSSLYADKFPSASDV